MNNWKLLFTFYLKSPKKKCDSKVLSIISNLDYLFGFVKIRLKFAAFYCNNQMKQKKFGQCLINLCKYFFCCVAHSKCHSFVSECSLKWAKAISQTNQYNVCIYFCTVTKSNHVTGSHEWTSSGCFTPPKFDTIPLWFQMNMMQMVLNMYKVNYHYSNKMLNKMQTKRIMDGND